MTTADIRAPIAPGEQAPDFALPAVDGTTIISLADYRDRSAVFLALFIGLWCPFCRRSIAQLTATQPRLAELGVQTLCVVATDVENARLYFKFRPTRLKLACDPGLVTHRGVRRGERLRSDDGLRLSGQAPAVYTSPARPARAERSGAPCLARPRRGLSGA